MNFGAPLPSTYKFKFFYYLVLVVLFLALISLKIKIHVLIEISRNIVYNDVYELVTIYIADLSPLSLNQLSQIAVTSYCSKSNYPSSKKRSSFQFSYPIPIFYLRTNKINTVKNGLHYDIYHIIYLPKL